MELIYDIFVIWMMTSVALGVGASTLAITSFLVALADGKIDSSERRMLQVIYWTLRWSMLTIPLTVGVVVYLNPGVIEALFYISTLIVVIYANAILMTLHKMPRVLGPAIQAGSWYTLGFLFTIELFSLAPVTGWLFVPLYAADILFFYLVIKIFLIWQRRPGK